MAVRQEVKKSTGNYVWLPVHRYLYIPKFLFFLQLLGVDLSLSLSLSLSLPVYNHLYIFFTLSCVFPSLQLGHTNVSNHLKYFSMTVPA